MVSEHWLLAAQQACVESYMDIYASNSYTYYY